MTFLVAESNMQEPPISGSKFFTVEGYIIAQYI